MANINKLKMLFDMTTWFVDWEFLLILSIPIFPKWISRHSPISSKNVQVSIICEQKLASIMVWCWFINLQNHPWRCTWQTEKKGLKHLKQGKTVTCFWLNPTLFLKRSEAWKWWYLWKCINCVLPCYAERNSITYVALKTVTCHHPGMLWSIPIYILFFF